MGTWPRWSAVTWTAPTGPGWSIIKSSNPLLWRWMWSRSWCIGPMPTWITSTWWITRARTGTPLSTAAKWVPLCTDFCLPRAARCGLTWAFLIRIWIHLQGVLWLMFRFRALCSITVRQVAYSLLVVLIHSSFRTKGAFVWRINGLLNWRNWVTRGAAFQMSVLVVSLLQHTFESFHHERWLFIKRSFQPTWTRYSGFMRKEEHTHQAPCSVCRCSLHDIASFICSRPH